MWWVWSVWPDLHKGSTNPCWVSWAKAQQILADFVEQQFSKSLMSWLYRGSVNHHWVFGVRLGLLPLQCQPAVGSLTQYIRTEPSGNGVLRLSKPLRSQRRNRLIENLLAHQESSSPLAHQESWESIRSSKRAKLRQARGDGERWRVYCREVSLPVAWEGGRRMEGGVPIQTLHIKYFIY